MGFPDKFVWSVNSHNLMDDAFHFATDPLAAAALADTHIIGKDEARLEQISFGALLHRVKYADGIAHQTFEAGAQNLAALLRIWTKEVQKRGEQRKWVKVRFDSDIQHAKVLYETVAKLSLAHWLDGKCKTCNGTKVKAGVACQSCKGSGEAPIENAGGFIIERTKDMVSELECIASSHAHRANKLLKS